MDNEKKIKEEALQSFKSYAEIVQKTVRETMNVGSLIVLGPVRPRHFLDVLKNVEESKEFISLAAIFSRAYGGSSRDYAIGRLQNYFRRSRLYLDIINGNPVDINCRFEELWSAFNGRAVEIITIRPINFVKFPEEVMDFGVFRIQKFSKDELDALLEQEVCEAFYPYAVADTSKLSLFWHIKETHQRNYLDEMLGNAWQDDLYRVKSTFPDMALQSLALFDWGNASVRPSDTEKERDLWLGLFDAPIAFTVSRDMIDSPMAFPDLSRLVWTYVNCEEEEFEVPQFEKDLTDAESNKLKDVVKTAHDFLESINLQECDWEFFEIAIGSLGKAFFSDGVEQLLWNMVALEALIGEKKETTQNIRRRLGLIWGGKDKKQIDQIYREFSELYNFRSSLVHGSKFGEGKKEKHLYSYHLRLARDYARKTVLWFISYLSHIHRELKKNHIPTEKYPKQKELLLLLDYQIQCFEHEGIKVIMPNNFPEFICRI